MKSEDGFMGGSINGFFEREGCCGVNFFSIQPALNYGFGQCTKPWMQPVSAEGPRATIEAMKDVIRFWLDLGCDGFRCDMAHSLVKKDPEQKETIKIWQEFRKMMDEQYPNCALLAEWGNPSKSLEAGFHMDFLLHFGPSHYAELFRVMPPFSLADPYFKRDGNGSITEFVETYKYNMETTNGEGLMCIPSGNHDMSRITSELDFEEIKLAYAFILSMPGVPFFYYGDEIGMNHVNGLKSVEGAFYRTGARTPMQWDHSVNDGFSTCMKEQLYIPMDEAENRPTVIDALEGKNELFNELKTLISIRKEHSALQSLASIEFLEYSDYPFIFKRKNHEEEIIVVINPKNQDIVLDKEIQYTNVVYENNGTPINKKGTCVIPKCSASYLKI